MVKITPFAERYPDAEPDDLDSDLEMQDIMAENEPDPDDYPFEIEEREEERRKEYERSEMMVGVDPEEVKRRKKEQEEKMEEEEKNNPKLWVLKRRIQEQAKEIQEKKEEQEKRKQEYFLASPEEKLRIEKQRLEDKILRRKQLADLRAKEDAMRNKLEDMDRKGEKVQLPVDMVDPSEFEGTSDEWALELMKKELYKRLEEETDNEDEESRTTTALRNRIFKLEKSIKRKKMLAEEGRPKNPKELQMYRQFFHQLKQDEPELNEEERDKKALDMLKQWVSIQEKQEEMREKLSALQNERAEGDGEDAELNELKELLKGDVSDLPEGMTAREKSLEYDRRGLKVMESLLKKSKGTPREAQLQKSVDAFKERIEHREQEIANSSGDQDITEEKDIADVSSKGLIKALGKDPAKVEERHAKKLDLQHREEHREEVRKMKMFSSDTPPLEEEDDEEDLSESDLSALSKKYEDQRFQNLMRRRGRPVTKKELKELKEEWDSYLRAEKKAEEMMRSIDDLEYIESVVKRTSKNKNKTQAPLEGKSKAEEYWEVLQAERIRKLEKNANKTAPEPLTREERMLQDEEELLASIKENSKYIKVEPAGLTDEEVIEKMKSGRIDDDTKKKRVRKPPFVEPDWLREEREAAKHMLKKLPDDGEKVEMDDDDEEEEDLAYRKRQMDIEEWLAKKEEMLNEEVDEEEFEKALLEDTPRLFFQKGLLNKDPKDETYDQEDEYAPTDWYKRIDPDADLDTLKDILMHKDTLTGQEISDLLDARRASLGVSPYMKISIAPFSEFGAIFRLENVLVDITNLQMAAWTRVAEQFGKRLPTLDQVKKATLYRSDIALRTVFRRWAQDNVIELRDMTKAHERAFKEIFDEWAKEYSAEPIDEFDPFPHKMHAAKIPLASGKSDTSTPPVVTAAVKEGNSTKDPTKIPYMENKAIKWLVWENLALENGLEPPTEHEFITSELLSPLQAIRQVFEWYERGELKGLLLAEEFEKRLKEEQRLYREENGLLQPEEEKEDPEEAESERLARTIDTEAWKETAYAIELEPPPPELIEQAINQPPQLVIEEIFGWTNVPDQVERVIAIYKEMREDALEENVEGYVRNSERETNVEDLIPHQRSTGQGPEPSDEEWAKILYEAWAGAADNHGHSLPVEEEMKKTRRMAPEKAITDLFEWTDKPGEVTAIKNTFVDCFIAAEKKWREQFPAPVDEESKREETAKMFTQSPHAARFIKALKKQEVAIGVISNLEQYQMDLLLELSGLDNLIPKELRVSGSSGYDGDEQQHLAAALRMDRKPNHCVVFDGTPSACDAAHSNKLKFCGMVGGYPTYDMLAADVSVRYFQDLAVMNIRRLFSDTEYFGPTLSVDDDIPWNPPGKKKPVMWAFKDKVQKKD